MKQSMEHNSADPHNALKGTEVFVGGLPRTISEDKIHEVFSSCGEIVEIRLIKDPKGNLKGFCFVRFATQEAARKAVQEKSGIMLDGKKIGVLPSSEQDTLYFGNLNKGWSAKEFERLVLQIFPDVVSIELAMLNDAQPGQKQQNRGFAFVKFTSHAAAARAYRVGSQPDFRLDGKLHPAVQWAEEEPEIDPKELAKIKIAFIRNLPSDADENYLERLFALFGKVDKVVVSKKGTTPVGFVHFAERLHLDRAIREMNEKMVQGPSGGPTYKLQVEVARPMDKNKKRTREDSQSKSSAVQSHSKLLKEDPGLIPCSNNKLDLQKEEEYADPYEAAVVALPLAVKERLLRILRLGIATRFDIDVQILSHLRQLTESTAISVLDKFMLSGADAHDKGAFLSGLIAGNQVDKVGLSRLPPSLTRAMDAPVREVEVPSFSSRVALPAIDSYASHAPASLARSDIYVPRYSPILSDYPLSTHAMLGREDERSLSPFDARPSSSLSYRRAGSRLEETLVSPPLQTISGSYAGYARNGLGSSSGVTLGVDRQTTRPRVRFDPFTGEPYKFDPFTGEPISPENVGRHF